MREFPTNVSYFCVRYLQIGCIDFLKFAAKKSFNYNFKNLNCLIGIISHYVI